MMEGVARGEMAMGYGWEVQTSFAAKQRLVVERCGCDLVFESERRLMGCYCLLWR